MKVEIEAESITDRGLNPQYQVNEDNYLVLEQAKIFAVADGVGGAHAGDVASQATIKAVEKMTANIERNQPGTSDQVVDFVKNLIHAANEVVYQVGKDKQRLVASTIAIMVVADDYAILAHVGDSRIYVARNNKLLQLTKDHSKLQDLLDDSPGRFVNHENYKEGHVLTRALGVKPSVEAEIQKVILRNQDIFLLCTDGIYTHNTNKEILESIMTYRSDLAKTCTVLKQNCYAKGAKDNLTAVVIRVQNAEQDEMDTQEIKLD